MLLVWADPEGTGDSLESCLELPELEELDGVCDASVKL